MFRQKILLSVQFYHFVMCEQQILHYYHKKKIWTSVDWTSIWLADWNRERTGMIWPHMVYFKLIGLIQLKLVHVIYFDQDRVVIPFCCTKKLRWFHFQRMPDCTCYSNWSYSHQLNRLHCYVQIWYISMVAYITVLYKKRKLQQLTSNM